MGLILAIDCKQKQLKAKWLITQFGADTPSQLEMKQVAKVTVIAWKIQKAMRGILRHTDD